MKCLSVVRWGLEISGLDVTYRTVRVQGLCNRLPVSRVEFPPFDGHFH